MTKYIYPRLGDVDLGFVKMRGPGLANMMFVAARAYELAMRCGGRFISPTWCKLSIGPILRREKDKRFYFGLFRNYGISGLKKLWLIHHVTHQEHQMDEFKNCCHGVLEVKGLGNYFQDLSQELASDYFSRIIPRSTKRIVEKESFDNAVAIHVRLGDYTKDVITPSEWFCAVIENMQKVNRNLKFLIFSDGSDEELAAILRLRNTRRVFFGNALADILAISNCKIVVASDSTFSAWGAFLGHRPVLFRHRHFPQLYKKGDSTPEYVLDNETAIPEDIIKLIK